jgi:hypothetical protein
MKIKALRTIAELFGYTLVSIYETSKGERLVFQERTT